MELNNNKTIFAIVVLGGVAVGAVLSHFATKKHLKSKIIQLQEIVKQLEPTVDEDRRQNFKNFLDKMKILGSAGDDDAVSDGLLARPSCSELLKPTSYSAHLENMIAQGILAACIKNPLYVVKDIKNYVYVEDYRIALETFFDTFDATFAELKNAVDASDNKLVDEASNKLNVSANTVGACKVADWSVAVQGRFGVRGLRYSFRVKRQHGDSIPRQHGDSIPTVFQYSSTRLSLIRLESLMVEFKIFQYCIIKFYNLLREEMEKIGLY